MVLGVLLVASSLSLGGRVDASALTRDAVHIGVPLYSDSVSDWSRVSGSPATSMIFLNPSDGPGDSLQGNYLSLVRHAQARGVRVLGYVDTVWGNGTVSISEAEASVDKYYSWYGVDGIMFDEVNDTCAPAPVTYYTELYNFVKQKTGADIVVLNPGTFVGECYARVSDVLITFEDTYANYLTYQQPNWVLSYPPGHFLHIVLDTPTVANMTNAIKLAMSRNVNGVYITDLGANGTNPYSSLPSYFGVEASVILKLQHHSCK